MEHTPGSWIHGDVEKLFRPPPGQYILVGPAGPYQPIVAQVLKQIGSAEDRPEAEANARLIAAAPALLEAGQSLLVALDTDQYGKITDDCVKVLEAAIAKATKQEDDR